MRAAALVLALVACGPGSTAGVKRALRQMEPADLFEADPVAWSAASAPHVFSLGVSFAPSWSDVPGDCIEVASEDGVTTWTADCVDADGTGWSGEVVQEGEVVRYHGFGYEAPTGCAEPSSARWDGTFEGPRGPEVGRREFEVTLRITTEGEDGADCEPVDGVTAVLYEGAVTWSGDLQDPARVAHWEGSGDYGRTEIGRAEVETVAEVVDDGVCTSEAASGVTSAVSRGHELALSYDGAEDCDPLGTADWSIDGVDQGEVTSVYCSTGPSTGTSLAALALTGALAVRRRRRAP